MAGKSDELKMPVPINLHVSGHRRLECIRNKREAAAKERHKAHTIYRATTKILFSLLIMFALISEFTMPKHNMNEHLTFRDRLVNKHHEVNELYDGTLNHVQHFSLFR